MSVVSVILAAKLAFLAMGVKPRTWREKREESTRVYLFLRVVTPTFLVITILVRETLAL